MDGACREMFRQIRLSGDEACFAVSYAVDPELMERLFGDIGARGSFRWGLSMAGCFGISRLAAFLDSVARCSGANPEVKVGVASCEAMDAESLLMAAQLAGCEAIRTSSPVVKYFGDAARGALERRQLTVELAAELKSGGPGIELALQPQVCMRGGALAGAEALARWKCGGVPVSPALFVPVVEESGLMIEFGRLAFAKGAKALAGLRRCGVGLGKVSVNVSLKQFADGDFLRFAAESARGCGLSCSDFELELTESCWGHGGAEEFSEQAAGWGFGLAIDDFGTGGSSLSRLGKVKAGKLKLDKSIVDGIAGCPQAKALCLAAISIAASLGMKPLAEGVESRAQAEILLAGGCDLAQGYLYGKPVDGESFAKRWAPGHAIP